MLKSVKSTVARYKMLSGGEDVTVALSGGADSVALLLAMLKIRDEYNLSICAIHVNHNLRGEESLRDEEFCRRLCRKLSVEFICESVDVAARRRKYSESTELAARNLRYAVLKKHAKGLIATAHNADDNAETVIYNLCRGAALKGLCGIPPKRDNIIRPLIKCERKDILKFLEECGQNFVTDSTNNTDDYTRNNIRHNILPLLKNVNGGIVENIARNSDSLYDDNLFLQNSAQSAFENYYADGILKKQVSTVPVAVLRRVLSMFYTTVIGKNPDLSHLAEMEKTVFGQIRRTSLEKGFYFVREENGYAIKKDTIAEEFCLKSSGNFYEFIENCAKFGKVSRLSANDFKKINKKLFKYSIDCDKIVGVVTVRTRLSGDKFRPVGRGVTKSVGKLLTENRCSDECRKSLVIVCDEKGIVFTSLFGIDERVKVTENSQNIVIIEI